VNANLSIDPLVLRGGAPAQAYDETVGVLFLDRFIRGTCPRCKARGQYGDSCEVCGATYQTALIDALRARGTGVRTGCGNGDLARKTELQPRCPTTEGIAARLALRALGPGSADRLAARIAGELGQPGRT
jgi:hypothetical protein